MVDSSCCTGIPSAPARPVAQEASSSAVIVHWLPPASSGNCTVSSYTVEYRQEGKNATHLLFIENILHQTALSQLTQL